MKCVIVGLIVLCLITSAAGARTIVLDESRPTRVEMVSDDLRSRSAPGLRFNASVGQLEAVEVETPRGTFTSLAIPGYQHSGIEGAPALPVMNTLIEVPFGGDVEVNVMMRTTERYELQELGIEHPIAPRQPSHRKSETEFPFAYEQSAYMAEGFQQDDLVTVDEIGVMRHVRLALLRIAPVAYSPTEGVIEVFNDIEVHVTVQNPNLRKTSDIKRRFASPVFEGIYRHIQSPPSLRLLGQRAESRPIRYLVISDPMYRVDLEPFLAWKTLKGFDVKTVYTDEIGATTDDMRDFVVTQYEGPTPPEYLLLVGDHTQVPAFRGTKGNHISDLYFVTMTDDYLPDIMTGRLSARNNDELVAQLDKILEYERYEMPDPSFLEHTLLIAGWDARFARAWGWPHINYGTTYYFNAENGMPHQHTFLSSGRYQNEEAIFDALNGGVGFVNYTAHGSPTTWADPRLNRSHIDLLENEGQYPLMLGNCCITSKFELPECFAEMVVRAPQRGALAYIGGTNNTYWNEDLWWGVGFYPIVTTNPEGVPPLRDDTGPGAYDGIFQGGFTTIYGMILAGNLAVETSNTFRKHYYWEIYHLMGDPSLKVYWGIPSRPQVEYAPEVTVDDGLVVEAPAGSYVGVTVDGVLVDGRFVDDSERATISLTHVAAGSTGTIVVTGQNLQPYEGSFTVID